MSEAATQKAKELLGDALKVSPEAIDADTAAGVSPEWDSLAHLNLILSLESHLDRTLTPDEIVSIGCLADVEALLD